jgi:hypothetical protein
MVNFPILSRKDKKHARRDNKDYQPWIVLTVTASEIEQVPIRPSYWRLYVKAMGEADQGSIGQGFYLPILRQRKRGMTSYASIQQAIYP